jgi:hypothetical protein
MVQAIGAEERKELFAGQSAVYLPTRHIVYASGNSLCAVPFDPDKLELKGALVPVIDGVSRPVIVPQFAISQSGILVYLPGKPGAEAGRALIWVNRDGGEEPLGVPPNMYRFPSISPDGTQLALTVETGANRDIHIWNISVKTLTRLTFDGKSSGAVWTPDGKRVTFFSTSSDGNFGAVYSKAANGTGNIEKIGSIPDRTFFPYSWSPAGNLVVGTESSDGIHVVLGMLSIKGEHWGRPLPKERFWAETQPKISPNGRWMAYVTGESAGNDVYVSSFPQFPDISKERWQISSQGGDSPLWGPDGRELFYRTGDEIMMVSAKTEPVFSIIGTPRALFRGTYVSVYSHDGDPWDIAPDGTQFVLPVMTAEGTSTPFTVILNWASLLKK